VLDTNVVSELRKVRSGKANSGVAEWAEQVPSVALFISSITIHELEHGVLLMERSDPTQRALLRAWIDQSVTAAFKNRVIAVDERVARRVAALHARPAVRSHLRQQSRRGTTSACPRPCTTSTSIP